MNGDRIARVRHVRELQERVLRAEWAVAERAAADAEERVRRLAELRAESGAKLAERYATGKLDPKELLNDAAALDRLDAAIVASIARSSEARKSAEARRAPWQARRTDAEALRRLETRQAALERAEAAKHEQAELDELSGARHGRVAAELAAEDHNTDPAVTRVSTERLRSDG